MQAPGGIPTASAMRENTWLLMRTVPWLTGFYSELVSVCSFFFTMVVGPSSPKILSSPPSELVWLFADSDFESSTLKS